MGSERVDRRRFIGGGIATALTSLVAGCEALPGSGDSSSASDDDEDGEDDDDGNGTPTFDGLMVGDEIKGEITEDAGEDPIRENLAVAHEFRITSEQSVTIHMDSNDFDSYVVVTDGNGQEVTRADDGGGSFNTEFTETFSPGTYVLWAGSFTGDSTGEYTITIEGADASDGSAPTEGPTGPGEFGSRLTLGDAVSGRITEEAGQDPVRDNLAVPHQLRLDTEQRVTIHMDSENFDPYVVVTDGNGREVTRGDDGGGSFNTEFTTTLPPGTYVLWAGSFIGDSTGEYTVLVEQA